VSERHAPLPTGALSRQSFRAGELHQQEQAVPVDSFCGRSAVSIPRLPPLAGIPEPQVDYFPFVDDRRTVIPRFRYAVQRFGHEYEVLDPTSAV
jgi:hypothetical protein